MKKLSKNAIIGYPAGIITGITYGLNPLFAVPLMKNGAATESILFFRYAFAVLLLGLFLKSANRVSGFQESKSAYCSSSDCFTPPAASFFSMHTNTSLPDWLLHWYSSTPSSWPLSWCS